tara:strand:+ start:52 stop:186 length:135 start_codon:yes stop_codon:yes gene_type:complete
LLNFLSKEKETSFKLGYKGLWFCFLYLVKEVALERIFVFKEKEL